MSSNLVNFEFTVLVLNHDIQVHIIFYSHQYGTSFSDIFKTLYKIKTISGYCLSITVALFYKQIIVHVIKFIDYSRKLGRDQMTLSHFSILFNLIQFDFVFGFVFMFN